MNRASDGALTVLDRLPFAVPVAIPSWLAAWIMANKLGVNSGVQYVVARLWAGLLA